MNTDNHFIPEITKWGHFVPLFKSDNLTIRKILIKPKCAIEMHKHDFRHEKWQVVEGCGQMVILSYAHEKQRMWHTVPLPPLHIFTAEPKTWHELQNTTDKDLVLIETRYGEKIDDNDIEMCNKTEGYWLTD